MELYTVPTGCGTKNYPRPLGLGASVATKNVVLMYPDIQQYMVGEIGEIYLLSTFGFQITTCRVFLFLHILTIL